jgi:single-strand DNA-binding protein
MNSVNLVGRLTKGPELSERDGTKVCDLRIAVNGRGKMPPLYIDVASFNRQAEACAEHLAKGSRVGVAGSLRLSQWQSNGSPRSRHSVVAREIQFLDTKSSASDEAVEQSS